MRTARSVVLVAFLAAACSSGVQSSSPVPSTVPASPSPAATVPVATGLPTATAPPATSHPTAVPTAEPSLPTAVPTAEPTVPPGLDCPTVAGLTVHEFVEADPACFGSRDVVLTAWLGALPAMGWEAPHIEPAWLYYPPNFTMSALWQRGPGGEEMCGDDDTDCAYRIVHLAPGSTIDLGETPRWVIATGHTGDPAAGTCHYIVGDDWPAPTPSNEGARAECAEQFVLTSLRDAPSAPTSPEP